jgi:hypothetical protein
MSTRFRRRCSPSVFGVSATRLQSLRYGDPVGIFTRITRSQIPSRAHGPCSRLRPLRLSAWAAPLQRVAHLLCVTRFCALPMNDANEHNQKGANTEVRRDRRCARGSHLACRRGDGALGLPRQARHASHLQRRTADGAAGHRAFARGIAPSRRGPNFVRARHLRRHPHLRTEHADAVQRICSLAPTRRARALSILCACRTGWERGSLWSRPMQIVPMNEAPNFFSLRAASRIPT